MGGFAVFGLIGLAAVYNDKPSKKPFVSCSCQQPLWILYHTAALLNGGVSPYGMLCWRSLPFTASCSLCCPTRDVNHIC